MLRKIAFGVWGLGSSFGIVGEGTGKRDFRFCVPFAAILSCRVSVTKLQHTPSNVDLGSSRIFNTPFKSPVMWGFRFPRLLN